MDCENHEPGSSAGWIIIYLDVKCENIPILQTREFEAEQMMWFGEFLAHFSDVKHTPIFFCVFANVFIFQFVLRSRFYSIWLQ